MARSSVSFPLIAAFLTGLFLGAAGGIHYERKALHGFWKRGPETSQIFTDLSHRLDLSALQQQKLQAILDAHHGQIMVIHQQVVSQLESLRQSFRQDLGGILTPAQQKKFAAMTAQWDARRQPLTAQAATPPAPSRGQDQ